MTEKCTLHLLYFSFFSHHSKLLHLYVTDVCMTLPLRLTLKHGCHQYIRPPSPTPPPLLHRTNIFQRTTTEAISLHSSSSIFSNNLSIFFLFRLTPSNSNLIYSFLSVLLLFQFDNTYDHNFLLQFYRIFALSPLLRSLETI